MLLSISYAEIKMSNNNESQIKQEILSNRNAWTKIISFSVTVKQNYENDSLVRHYIFTDLYLFCIFRIRRVRGQTYTYKHTRVLLLIFLLLFLFLTHIFLNH
jgi:hypothetical protein